MQNDVEIFVLAASFIVNTMLQWGHVQNDVEMWQAVEEYTMTGICFNGATCKMTWKSPLPRADAAPPMRFNGATCKMTWKLT